MKKLITWVSLIPLLVLASLLTAASPEPSPTTKPAPKYRMVAVTVHGVVPRQWVLIITAPDGSPAVTAPEKLEEYVQLVVPEHATLEWAPSDCVIGGEPLRSDDDLHALAEFCKQHKINFVIIPAG